MTLIWFDGFDTVTDTSQSLNSWIDSFTTDGSNGRFGGRAATWTNGGTPRLAVPSASTYVIGLAWKMSNADATAGRYIIQFNEGGTIHLGLEYADGTNRIFRVKRGDGTLLGTCTMPQWIAATYTHIQMKATIHDSTGSFEVIVNGNSALSVSGVDTRNGGTGVVTQFAFRGDFTSYWDDMWVDTANFLGDCKVETIRPDGAGNSTQFTPSTGSNWQNVDENTPNNDTDYNSSSTAGNIDLFTMGNLATTSGTVKGVQVRTIARKDDAGSRTMRSVIRTGATNYESGDHAMGDSYLGFTDFHLQNPNTSSAWTISDINGLEAGYKIQS